MGKMIGKLAKLYSDITPWIQTLTDDILNYTPKHFLRRYLDPQGEIHTCMCIYILYQNSIVNIGIIFVYVHTYHSYSINSLQYWEHVFQSRARDVSGSHGGIIHKNPFIHQVIHFTTLSTEFDRFPMSIPLLRDHLRPLSEWVAWAGGCRAAAQGAAPRDGRHVLDAQ